MVKEAPPVSPPMQFTASNRAKIDHALDNQLGLNNTMSHFARSMSIFEDAIFEIMDILIPSRSTLHRTNQWWKHIIANPPIRKNNFERISTELDHIWDDSTTQFYKLSDVMENLKSVLCTELFNTQSTKRHLLPNWAQCDPSPLLPTCNQIHSMTTCLQENSPKLKKSCPQQSLQAI